MMEGGYPLITPPVNRFITVVSVIIFETWLCLIPSPPWSPSLDVMKAPYVVENVDPTHRVYFRQKGAEWCPWQSVGPGEKKG